MSFHPLRRQAGGPSPSTPPRAARRLRSLALAALVLAPAVSAWAQGGAGPADNPYSLQALWQTGDAVAKGTLLILAVMSLGSWFILATKLLDQLRLNRQAREAREQFWAAGSVQQGIQALGAGSAFRFIAETGAQASEHHEGRLTDQIDFNTWVTLSIQRSVEQVQSQLQNGLAFLATVGSTSPFIGLFGTVWGIYHALTAIGIAGQASIDKVAGPVGEALIMTAIGLAVAVPAVLGYNWLVRRNKAALDQVRSFSADLHAVLLGGRARAAASEVITRSAAPAAAPRVAVAGRG